MQKRVTTYIALTLSTLFWGLSFIAVKIALTDFTPFAYMFLRFALASVFFLVLMLVRGFPKLEAGDHKKLFLIGLFEPGLYFIFETFGLTYTTASKASIIIAALPVIVLLLARLFLNEKISGKSVWGVILSMAGIIILILGDPKFSISSAGAVIGDVLIFGAVISAAFYMIIARDLGQKLSAFEITSFQVFYGAILFAPLFLMNMGSVQWAEISVSAAGAVVFLAVFATVLAYLFNNYALTQIPASQAAVFINGIPVVTTIGAWFILDERLTLLQAAGGALVLIAVMVANKPAGRTL
ncbi:MAG TPA: DMT family transporter [Syntrophomonas sp.]|nr:DMT family transporter [Syntrophomonas sp.]